MQILAVGIHRQNIADTIWQAGTEAVEPFYHFIQKVDELEAGSEFLFVNSSQAREIVAFTENINGVRNQLKKFFRDSLKPAKQDKLIFHELEGPDAVKHFLQLSVGVEPASDKMQYEFLRNAQESIAIANELNIAGPVINRMYHGALILKGKIKRNEVSSQNDFIGEQIQQLIFKIFGSFSDLNMLMIGHNDPAYSVIDDILSQNENSFQVYTFATSQPNELVCAGKNTIIQPGELLQTLRKCQVVFRLNQEARHLFEPGALNKLMVQRKNQPLLIVNLDSTIVSGNALNRIYNLYVYDITDFQTELVRSGQHIDMQDLIEAELKEFFSWFYSKDRYRFGNVIAKSAAMEQILEMIARISQTDITVLIQGASGTGKEIIAKAIHQNNPRRERPFIVVNCGALPDTLLESELFGHEKGAFTGATYTKKGLFEEAHRGTIFLDEIGDTSAALQVKLLRVLQEGEIKRVGSTETIRIDVRLIAASNQNLAELVQQNTFRQDLFYRLNVVNIQIPPLKDRKEDILPLTEYFMDKYAEKMKKRVSGLADRARQMLLMYSWPGNVRELENAIERAVALSIGNIIHTDDLPEHIRQAEVPGIVQKNLGKQRTLKEIEKEVIHTTLIANLWNYDKVAEILDIGRTTLWRKMKEYGISKK